MSLPRRCGAFAVGMTRSGRPGASMTALNLVACRTRQPDVTALRPARRCQRAGNRQTLGAPEG